MSDAFLRIGDVLSFASHDDAEPADVVLANHVASAICGLVAAGAKLGELDERELIDATCAPRLGDDGAPCLDADGRPELVPRTVKALPAAWLERLARAIDVGAFDRLSVQEIVDRILLPPLPSAAGG